MRTSRSNIMTTGLNSHMRAQSWILKLVAAALATSAAVITYAQEPQKQSPEKPAQSTQDNQPGSKKKEDDAIIEDLGIVYTAIDVSVTDGANRPIPDLGHEDFAIFEDDVKQEI